MPYKAPRDACEFDGVKSVSVLQNGSFEGGWRDPCRVAVAVNG